MTNQTQTVKHTPGPWEVIYLNSPYVTIGKTLPDSVNGYGTYNIHLTKPITTGYWGTDVNREAEMKANAQLIAAAPELLEALKTLYSSWIEACVFHGETFQDKDSEGWEISHQVLNAIAKAEGR